MEYLRVRLGDLGTRFLATAPLSMVLCLSIEVLARRRFSSCINGSGEPGGVKGKIGLWGDVVGVDDSDSEGRPNDSGEPGCSSISCAFASSSASANWWANGGDRTGLGSLGGVSSPIGLCCGILVELGEAPLMYEVSDGISGGKQWANRDCGSLVFDALKQYSWLKIVICICFGSSVGC